MPEKETTAENPIERYRRLRDEKARDLEKRTNQQAGDQLKERARQAYSATGGDDFESDWPELRRELIAGEVRRALKNDR